MIDREARDRLADCLRLLLKRRITQGQFFENRPQVCLDLAVVSGWSFAKLYSETPPCVCLFRSATSAVKEKRIAARWLLFLRTDLEYEEPPPPVRDKSRLRD